MRKPPRVEGERQGQRPAFFTRMQGFGPWATLLKTRFDRAVRTHGLNIEKQRLRTDLFDPPQGAQLRLI